MNFRHLRYFIAASEHGSFRKASAALGVQESTISRRVRDMEDGLGSALFHRHSGGVCLTVAGQRLLSRARKVLRYVNEGAEIVDAVGRAKEGHLRIGIFSSLASGFLVSAVPLAPLLERSERRCLKPLRAWTHDDFRAYA